MARVGVPSGDKGISALRPLACKRGEGGFDADARTSFSPPFTVWPRHGPAVELGLAEVGHGADVLVAPSREVDQQDLSGQGGRQLDGMRHRVARFERRDDALGAAQAVEGGERLRRR